MKKIIALADITRDPGLQTRVELDEPTTQDYLLAMRDEGVKFPPITLFEGGGKFLLADGFHRLRAAQLAGHIEIEADVQPGGRSEALKFALQSNSTHGLPRNNADKHRAVELALAEWPTLSSREVGRICGVSNVFVESKRQVLTVNTSGDNEHRTGRDRKSYQVSGGYKGPSSFHKWSEPSDHDAPSDEAPEKSKAFGGLRPDESERKGRLLNGETVLANARLDKGLVEWAKRKGLDAKIDRDTPWGNPWLVEQDGTRDEVCDWYRDLYWPHKRSLHTKLDGLKGKLLICWCYPDRCHGLTIIEALNKAEVGI